MPDISESQFIRNADTFDVILFKTKTPKGEQVRKKTNYEFGKNKLAFLIKNL